MAEGPKEMCEPDARRGEPIPAEPAPVPPSAAALAAKANDLEAIRAAVVDAASVSASLWLSYLFVLFYLLIAAAGVTHRDLFLENPVKLPFLNVDLPLKGFFWLGPALFLIVHGYVLLHFVLLAGKVGVFDRQLRAQIDDPDVRASLRLQLPSNIFVQFLAGPREVREGILGCLLWLIALISLVISPVALLVFFELQFLPYHDVWITWWQRIAVVIDLTLLWALWPAIAGGEGIGTAWRSIRRTTIAWVGLISLVPVLLAVTIATFPGEWLEEKLPAIPFRKTLVAGEVDFNARRPVSFWSNKLVLPGIVIDPTGADSGAKVAALSESGTLRTRHLEGAVLISAILREVDFNASRLQGASLGGAQLQRASLLNANLKGASLFNAQLQGASLGHAHLEGVSLMEVRLQGAWLQEAHLEGGLLDGAQLQGAVLDQARLQGASLKGAWLQGASLNSAQLQGALLDGAHLEGASLDGAQLQGASLNGAQLQGASLKNAFVWRASIEGANARGAAISALEVGPRQFCPSGCAWSVDSLGELKQLIERETPRSEQRGEVLARLDARLDPTKPLDGEHASAAHWADLQSSSPTLNVHEEELAEQWREAGCALDGAPHVLTRLIGRVKVAVLSPFAQDSPQVPRLALEFLKQDCAGARGISEDTKAELEALRRRPSSDPAMPDSGAPKP